MARPQPPEHDPVHLLFLRALVYTSAALLFAGPVAGTAGCASAAAAAVLGVLLARALSATCLRLPVVLGLALGSIGAGLFLAPLLGNVEALARLLGTGAMMSAIDGLTFGLATLGTVLGLRTLAGRAKFLGLVEMALVVGVVIALFAGHRGGQIQQPMFLADWAWTHGYNPLHVYLAIGLVTLIALTLLLVHTVRSWKTALALALLWSCAVAVFLLIFPLLPRDTVEAPDQVAHTGPNGDNPVPADRDPNDGSTPPPSGKPQLDPGSRKPWPSKPRPMAVVILHKEYDPVEQVYYFRMNAFSQFESGRFVETERTGMDTDHFRRFPTKRVELPGVTPVFELDTVPVTIALIARHDKAFALVNPLSLEPCDNPNPQAFLAAYRGTSRVIVPVKGKNGREEVPYDAIIRCRGGDPAWPAEVRRLCLAHPDDPRLTALAAKITADMGRLAPEDRASPFLRALAVRRYVEENITYALKADHSKAPDVALSVLFGDRRGHCVHMAYAMTALLRAMGVPARMAGGYAFESRKRGSGASLLLTETDLHAWCEIYLAGLGWVVIDASPKNSEDAPPPVVSADLQKLYGEMARGNNPDSSPKKADDTDWSGLGTAASLPLPLVLLALYAVKAWRRLLPRFAPARCQYRACYRAVLDRLADVGLTRRFGETREEFAQRLAELVPSLVQLTAGHMRRAVGGVESLDRRQWLELLKQADAALAAKFSALRRGLGLVNPVSWLAAR